MDKRIGIMREEKILKALASIVPILKRRIK